jgi:hypothetical protein
MLLSEIVKRSNKYHVDLSERLLYYNVNDKTFAVWNWNDASAQPVYNPSTELIDAF